MKSSTAITFVGHATILIEMDGARILTDPLLRSFVIHLRRTAPSIKLEDLEDIDAILISHQHLDHLHLPSLKMLPRSTQIYLPRGTRKLVEGKGFANITEIEVDQEVQVGEILIRATPAEHSGRRILPGEEIECLGYVLEGSEAIYFAGDTDLFPGMEHLSENLDVALLPVWGWGPNLGPGHMDPYRAALALQHLRPRMAIPIHWGTYHPIGMGWLRPVFLTNPPALFKSMAEKIAPSVEVRVLKPGECTLLRESSNNS